MEQDNRPAADVIAFYLLFRQVPFERIYGSDESALKTAGDRYRQDREAAKHRMSEDDWNADLDDLSAAYYRGFMAWVCLTDSLRDPDVLAFISASSSGEIEPEPLKILAGVISCEFPSWDTEQQYRFVLAQYTEKPLLFIQLHLFSMIFYSQNYGLTTKQQDSMYGIYSIIQFHQAYWKRRLESIQLTASEYPSPPALSTPAALSLLAAIVDLLDRSLTIDPSSEEVLSTISALPPPNLDAFQRNVAMQCELVGALLGCFPVVEEKHCENWCAFLGHVRQLCLKRANLTKAERLFATIFADAIWNSGTAVSAVRLAITVPARTLMSVPVKRVAQGLQRLAATLAGDVSEHFVQFQKCDDGAAIERDDGSFADFRVSFFDVFSFLRQAAQLALTSPDTVLLDELISKPLLVLARANKFSELLRSPRSRDARWAITVLSFLQMCVDDPTHATISAFAAECIAAATATPCEGESAPRIFSWQPVDVEICGAVAAISSSCLRSSIFLARGEELLTPVFINEALLPLASLALATAPEFARRVSSEVDVSHCLWCTRTEHQVSEMLFDIAYTLCDVVNDHSLKTESPLNPSSVGSLVSCATMPWSIATGAVSQQAICTLSDIVKFRFDDICKSQDTAEFAAEAFAYVAETRQGLVQQVSWTKMESYKAQQLGFLWHAFGTALYGFSLLLGKIQEQEVKVSVKDVLRPNAKRLRGMTLYFITTAASSGTVDDTPLIMPRIENGVFALTRLLMFFSNTMPDLADASMFRILFQHVPVAPPMSIIGAVANQRAVQIIRVFGLHPDVAVASLQKSFVANMARYVQQGQGLVTPETWSLVSELLTLIQPPARRPRRERNT